MKMHTYIPNVRPLLLLWVVLGLFAGCDKSTYDQWDDNDDQALNEQEFLEGFNTTDNFSKWDLDRDGSLSQNEFLTGSFAMLDLSNDESLGNDEWTKFTDHFNEEMDTDLSSVDRDGDGEVSKSEFIRHLSHEGLYTSWDANQNNQLDPAEFARGIFSAWDADDSGTITEAEFTSWQENLQNWHVVSMENLMPDPDATGADSTGGVTGEGQLSESVQAFVDYVNTDQKVAGNEHSYATNGLMHLADALDEVAGDNEVEAENDINQLRETARSLGTNPGSEAHADSIASAFKNAANILMKIEEKSVSGGSRISSEVMSAAEAINPDEMANDQTGEITTFFEEVAGALESIASNKER